MEFVYVGVFQQFIIIHNKSMSSYLEKYHLQKVEPVKNRNKRSHPDLYKLKQKVQKGNIVKIPIRPRPPHRPTFDNYQDRLPIRNPQTQQLIRHHHELPDESFRNKTAKDKKKDNEFSEEKMTHRSHQSLNFKSAKETSTGTKILSSIQDFFSKLLRSNEGCSCGDPCPYAIKFFQWADVPYQVVKDHYFKMLNGWEQAIRNNPNQSSECSIQDYLDSRASKSSKNQQLKKNSIQIKKDINRTQSDSLTFQNNLFKERMANILMSYGFEDPKVGYIQGMNMILSGVIYHVKDEIKSYAVFRELIFTIRNIYFNGFKECYQHIEKIRAYVNTHIHDLYEMFEELAVDLNIVCLPWVLSLLTSLVPLEYLHLVFLGFFEGGWPFFYRVCLAIMIYHKQHIIDLYDSGQILSLFSATNQKKGDYDWQDIIQYSKSIVL